MLERASVPVEDLELFFPFENTAFSFNFDIAPQISDCMIVTLLLTSDFNACVVSNEGTNNC